MIAFYELREFKGLHTPCFSFGLVEFHPLCMLIAIQIKDWRGGEL